MVYLLKELFRRETPWFHTIRPIHPDQTGDFFHDSEARVASAFAHDRETLVGTGYLLEVELSLPGLVRAVVRRGEDATRIDWAHDSACASPSRADRARYAWWSSRR